MGKAIKAWFKKILPPACVFIGHQWEPGNTDYFPVRTCKHCKMERYCLPGFGWKMKVTSIHRGKAK